MPSEIQAVLFNKKYYYKKEAKKWLKINNFKPIKKVHVTKNYLRYRLKNPNKYKNFITKSTKENIKFIIGFY